MINKFLKYKGLLEDFLYMYSVVIVQRILGIITTYFLVRILSETQFAEYSLIIGYLSLFAAFSLPGLGDAVLQSTARGNSSDFYLKAQKWSFLGTVFAGIALVAFSFVHSNNGDYTPTLQIGILCAALFLPFYRGLFLWKSNWSGLKKFKSISKLSNAASIVMYSVMIYLLAVMDVSSYLSLLIVYMLVPSLLNIVIFTWDFVTVCRRGKSENNADSAAETGLMSYGLKTSLYAGIHTLALRLDSFLLFYLISPEVMALYTVANKIPEMFRGVTQTLAAILAPRFAKHNMMTAAINRAIKLYSLGFGLAIIAMTFTIYPYLMNFLFGDLYNDAIFYSQIIMCSLVIGNMANLNFRFIRSQKDSDSFRNVTLVISAIRILTVIILVPFIGIWGAIVSLFLYRVSMWLIVENIIRKKYT